MNTRSIKSNYFYNLLYQIVALLVPFVTAPYTSRVLEADGIGKYSYYTAIVYYFTLLANLGINSYGQIEVAKIRDNQEKLSKLFSELVSIKFILGIVCSIIFFIFTFSAKDQKLYIILYPTLLAGILDIGWFYTGIEDFKRISIRSTVMRLVNVASLFIFVREKEDLLLYALLNSVLSLAGSLVLWVHINRFVTLSLRKMSSSIVLQHFRGCFIFFLPTVANTLYTIFSKTLLGLIGKSDFENGYYEQSYRVITIVMALLSSLFGILCSRISFLYEKKDEAAVQQNINLGINYTLFLAFPIMCGLFITSDNFIRWFLGEKFIEAIPILKVFCFIILMQGMADCLGSVFYNPTGRRWLSCKLLFAGVAVNLVANVFLIPKYQAFGAAVSTTLSETTVCLLYIIFSIKHIDYHNILKQAWKYPVSAAIMLIVLQIASNLFTAKGPWLTIIQIVIGAAIYFFALVVLRDSLLLEFFKRVNQWITHRRKN